MPITKTKRKLKNPCTFLYHFVRTKFVFTFKFHIVIRRTLKGFPTLHLRCVAIYVIYDESKLILLN